jgi:DNA-binding PucR family transcriptional regulator
MPTSLARVLDDLGDVLLEPIAGVRRQQLGGVVIHDPDDSSDFPEQAIVLGVGVRNVAELLIEHGCRGVKALVVRGPVEATPEVRRAAEESGVALLGLADGASWAQLAALLRTLLAEGEIGAPEPADDLFAVANAIAALLDAPVTIEDPASRVLAFSGRQDEADESRVETILGRQVPARFTVALKRNGVFDRLHRQREPVYIDLAAQDAAVGLPRVAVAVRAGDEVLGSIWAAVREPLSEERTRALVDATKVVALHLLRLRAGADVERRLRTDLVSTALEGGAAAPEAVVRLGLLGRPTMVMAMGVVPGEDDDADRTADGQRFADALAVHLAAVQPRSAVALLGEVAYAIVPVEADCRERSIRLAEGFLARMGERVAAVIGIGQPARDAFGLRRSRDGADRALRVLLTEGGSRRVATVDDVHIDALLLELNDLMAARGDTVTGPIARLRAYDARHNADLVRTLRCWLDAFGDVTAAAAAAYVHVNTFRYRLKRVAEVGEIDLNDSGQRFAAMLQLRLAQLGEGVE